MEPQNWPSKDLAAMAREWRDDVAELASAWTELGSRERFAMLQQVCGVLRTGLTKDVETRLR